MEAFVYYDLIFDIMYLEVVIISLKFALYKW